MKIGIIVVLALFASAFGAHFLLSDPGYVVINFRGYVVEMSVPVLVLLTAALFGFIWLARKIIIAPRRIGEVASLFVDSGVMALTAFISPYRGDRDTAREVAGEGNFIEVYVQCALDVCEERDVKGLYKKARAGEIPEFTGISAPYEEPLKAEIVVDTGKETLEESAQIVLAGLRERGLIE